MSAGQVLGLIFYNFLRLMSLLFLPFWGQSVVQYDEAHKTDKLGGEDHFACSGPVDMVSSKLAQKASRAELHLGSSCHVLQRLLGSAKSLLGAGKLQSAGLIV